MAENEDIILLESVELGDIIRLQAPSNIDIHNQTFYVYFVDRDKLKMLNTTSEKEYLLAIRDFVQDETIIGIDLVSRSPERGFAAQHGLVPGQWIDLYFGGDHASLVWGKITGLEEDMIQVMLYSVEDNPGPIYIDFAYEGIPEDSMIEKIVVRPPPHDARELQEKYLPLGTTLDHFETTEEAVEEEKEPSIPTNNQIVEEFLQADDEVSNIDFFENELDDIFVEVAVSEEHRRFSEAMQLAELTNHLLSKYPLSERTVNVHRYVHFLVSRFRQLRREFSEFRDGRIVMARRNDFSHNPITEAFTRMRTSVPWVIPVVYERTRLYKSYGKYSTEDVIDFEDLGYDEHPLYVEEPEAVVLKDLVEELKDFEKQFAENRPETLKHFAEFIANEFVTYANPPEFGQKSSYNEQTVFLRNVPVQEDAEVLVGNNHTLHKDPAGDFQCSVVSKAKDHFLGKRHVGSFVNRRYNAQLGLGGKADKVHIRSVLLLPKSVCLQSAAFTGKSSIYMRSLRSQTPLYKFKLLNKHAQIERRVVDGIEFGETEQSNGFLKKPTHYVLYKQFNGVNAVSNFQSFLDDILPKPSLLLKWMEDNIPQANTTLLKMTDLEPYFQAFLVESDFLSSDTWEVLSKFLNEQQKNMFRAFTEAKKRATEYIRVAPAVHLKQVNATPYGPVNVLKSQLLEPLREQKSLQKQIGKIFESRAQFQYEPSSEILQQLLEGDYAKTLTTFIHSTVFDRITLLDAAFLDKLVKPALVEGDVVATKNLTKCDVVRPQVIAKRYASLASLQKDNGKASLYFDKEFDDTPYHLVDLYKDEKARFSDNEEKFHEFFAQTLINKHSCPAAMADELATNIINKRKPVKDGHYAVWNDEEDARYYKYHANKRQWVLDKDVDVNKFMSPNELFCELTSATECVKVDDINRCIPMEMEAVRMRMARRSQILTEFNTRIAKSFREMKTQLEKDKKTVFAEFENRRTAAAKQRQRQSHWSYRLGEKLVGALELAESPHAATMEDILAWDNFRERQLMIREFRKKFCREPIVDAEEKPFWLYCTESNLPLLPKSLSLLADAEANGTYIEVMEHLLGTVGEKSDDYDSIVDKHTGFVLQKLQFFDEDSVNEDGTKRTTHGVLDADPVFIEGGGAMATSSVHVVPVAFANNTTMQQCYRVLSTLCKNMHVPLRFDLEDFVLHTASNFMQYMFTEETYNKNKKNTVSYQDQKDYFVIFSVAAALLIGLQTSIPHTDTESAMIGCRKSFAGFPLDLNEHETQGIEYIACALHKTNPKTDVPWIAVKSKNEEFFKRGLLAALKNLGMKPVDVAANKTKKIGLLDLPEVKAVLLKKRDWLEQHPQDAAETSQGDITTLQRMFLPPLVHTHLNIGEDVHGITEAQEASVLADLKAGSKQQHKQIMQTHAKIIKHGYAMHQVIAGEMSRAPPLSVKALRPPLFYFAEKAKELELLQQRSITMEHLLQRVRQFTAPETFYCYGNSRIESGPLDSTIHSKVVFLSFMHYCNFENDAPIPEYLRGLVSEKPAYDKNSTFEEKVNFMKLNQMNFSLEQFHRLMHLVNGKNKVAVPEHPPVTDADTAAATNTNDENTGIINEIIRKHLSNLLEANHANDRELMEASSKALQNYLTVTIRKLINSADSASTSITDFMDTFLMVAESGKKSTVEQEKTKFVDFFMKKSLADWKNKDEGVILQQMHNAVANFGKVYPAYLFGPMNSRQKFRADDKTLPFAAEHKDIVLLTSLHKRLQLDKFTSVFKGGDERLQNIVREGMRRSAHVLVFLETLSAAHKTLLPKQVLYLLYRYCAVSVINEYIYVASSNYPLNVVSLKPSESTIQGVRPVRVDMSANKENEQLYQHLASLLHMFVHLEQDDNRQIDLDYAQIMFATTELKRAETKRILDNLGKMTPEQKESAMRRKQYRIGEYSGYSGKQLTGYSGAQWMKEANELTEYYDAVIESANIDELNNMNEHEDPSVPNDPDEYDGNDDND